MWYIHYLAGTVAKQATSLQETFVMHGLQNLSIVPMGHSDSVKNTS